jgi:hypothetical protein
MALAQTVLLFASVWSLSELMTAMRVRWQWLWLILLAIPLVSAVVLIVLNVQATIRLNAKGFKVGLFGCDPNSIAQRYNRQDLASRPAIAATLSTGRAVIVTAVFLFLSAMDVVSEPNVPGRPDAPVVAVSNVADAERQRLRDNTIAYWARMKSILEAVPSNDSGPAQFVAGFRRQAAELRSIPTVGIDTDAVAVSLDAATMLDTAALDINRFANGQVYLEAIIRGAKGEPFGTAQDQMTLQEKRKSEINQFAARWANTRAILSARYQVQFP